MRPLNTLYIRFFLAVSMLLSIQACGPADEEAGDQERQQSSETNLPQTLVDPCGATVSKSDSGSNTCDVNCRRNPGQSRCVNWCSPFKSERYIPNKRAERDAGLQAAIAANNIRVLLNIDSWPSCTGWFSQNPCTIYVKFLVANTSGTSCNTVEQSQCREATTATDAFNGIVSGIDVSSSQSKLASVQSPLDAIDASRKVFIQFYSKDSADNFTLMNTNPISFSVRDLMGKMEFSKSNDGSLFRTRSQYCQEFKGNDPPYQHCASSTMATGKIKCSYDDTNAWSCSAISLAPPIDSPDHISCTYHQMFDPNGNDCTCTW